MFIRTKEGKIIDIDKRFQWHLENSWINKRIKDKETFIKISHHNIIAEADNIQELCDDFVVKEYDNITIYSVRYLLEDAKSIFDNEKDLYPDLKIELYGAIWTDKGLIYVAKMNEKGELELL